MLVTHAELTANANANTATDQLSGHTVPRIIEQSNYCRQYSLDFRVLVTDLFSPFKLNQYFYVNAEFLQSLSRFI